MRRPCREGGISPLVILILLLSALTGCSMLKPQPVVVMPEARAVRLQQAQPAPMNGWLLSESALAKLLEAAERCKQP